MEKSLFQPRSMPRRWAACVALFAMAVSQLPYLVGWSFAGKRHFMWLGYNFDDSCVYLSWMRQAADGSTWGLNLFTTEPQHGMLINPLFLLLGWFARLAHLNVLVVYHLARLSFGFGLLMLVWEFLRENVTSIETRKLALLCVAFASGLGWLPWLWNSHLTIDTWQPEAITFLSLYLSPLFCFSMALQVGILLLLQKGERTGRARYAVCAGLCGFALGLIHTYDIITMCTIWAGYLLLRLLFPLWKRDFPRLPPVAWIHALIASAITFPSVSFIVWELYTESVFLKRANVKTLAPGVIWVGLGYGLLLALDLLALFIILRRDTREPSENTTQPEDDRMSSQFSKFLRDPDSLVLLIIWPILNLAVSYLPVAFQRKMLQGEHFPIAILAGIGASWLLARPIFLTQRWRFNFASVLLIFVLSISNLQFMLRDIDNFEDNRVQTHIHRAYLEPGELDALNWIEVNTPPGASIQPMPWVTWTIDKKGRRMVNAYDITLSSISPSIVHRRVYCGHFGETPDFNSKLNEASKIVWTNDAERTILLRKMKVDYIIFSQKRPLEEDIELLALFTGAKPHSKYLVLVYTNEDADVYKVQLPH